MNTAVQITFIICATLIVLSILGQIGRRTK